MIACGLVEAGPTRSDGTGVDTLRSAVVTSCTVCRPATTAATPGDRNGNWIAAAGIGTPNCSATSASAAARASTSCGART